MSTKFRYPGTEPFSAKDKDIFFGRDEDIQKLYQAILLEQITVLHGKSGYGKTSLLRAGILPMLEREDNLQSFYIRPGRYKSEEGVGLLEKFHQKAFPDGNPSSEILADLGVNSNSLWYLFKSLQIENPDLSGFVVILDQFEECFSYTHFQLEAFKKELSDLLFVKLPLKWRDQLKQKLRENPEAYSEETLALFYAPINVKVVFSIRSDKLGLMDHFKDYFPNILQNNYVLDALKRQQAGQAITAPAQLDGTFYSPKFAFTEPALDLILDFLANKFNHTIEAFQLQMVCQYIEMYLVNPDKTLVETYDLENLDEVVENFYDKQIERLGGTHVQELARALMEKLIFEEDLQRISVYEKQIFRDLNITPDLLNKMVECRLVRGELSQSTNATMYEITHDTLALAVIKSKRKREREVLQSEIEEKSRLQRKVNSLEKKWKEELEQTDMRIEQYEKRLTEDGKLPLEGRTDYSLSNLYYQRGYLYANLKSYDLAIKSFNRAIEFDDGAAYLYNSRGIVFYDSGQYEEAVKDYLKAIDIDPKQAYYFSNLGLAYERLNELEQAVVYYNLALIEDPNYSEAYNNRGNIHFKKSEFEKAELDYKRALDLDPTNPIYWRNLGGNYNQLAQPEKAHECYNKAIENDPDYPDSYNSRGNIFFAQRKYKAAIADYERAIELNSGEAIFYRNLGLAYEKVGEPEKAFSVYSKAISLNPDYSEPYNNLGNIFYDRKKYDEAINHYNKAIALNGNQAIYYRNLGLTLERIDQRDKALEVYSSAIQLNPSYSEAYNSRGNIYYDRAQYNLAIEDYLLAIEHNPKESIYYRNLGLSYEKLGQKEKTVECYNQAIELNPNYADAYNSRGNIYYGWNDYEQAIKNYEKAIEIQAGESIFHRNLGMVYEDLNQKEKALKYYEKAIELNPAYSDAHNSRGNIFYDKKEYKEALKNYDKAIEFHPDQAIYYRNRALTYEYLGESQKALENYEQAIEKNPNYADAYHSRGALYYNLGEFEKSVASHQKAIDLNDQVSSYWRGLGMGQTELNRLNEAIKSFDQAISLAPNKPDPYNDKANIFFSKYQDYKKALELYKKAVELSPKEPIFWINLANNYIFLEDYDMSVKSYDEAIALMPDNPDLYIQQGGLYQDFLKIPEKAIKNYDKALSLEPNDELKGEIYRNKAEFYAGQKNVKEAEHFLNLALPLSKEDSFWFFLKAKINAAKGDMDGFYEELQKSLDTEPVHRFYFYLENDELLSPLQKEERFQKMVEAFKAKAQQS